MEKTNSQIHHLSTQCIAFYHNWLRDEQGKKRGFENTCSVLRYRVDFFEKDECCRFLFYFVREFHICQLRTTEWYFAESGTFQYSRRPWHLNAELCISILRIKPFPSSLPSLFQSEAKCSIILMWMKPDIHKKDSPWNRGSSELQKGLIPILIFDDCTNQSVPLCITIDQIH